MKFQKHLTWLIPLIGLLALFAASMGLFYQSDGQPYAYTSYRGEAVTINGHGLYRWDTVSTVAQMEGNDIITLAVGLPLLIAATLSSFRGSLRGRLLLTGTLGFFLYTYMSMSMLTAYNALFLVYIVLFGLSLYAFILCLLSFDLADLPRHFSAKLPLKWIAGLLFVIAGFLSMAWLGRIVPLALIAGVLLLRRNAWGYLLASVFVLKAITMGLAVSTMAIKQALAGVPESGAIAIPFLVITALNLVMVVVLLRNVREGNVPLTA